MERLGVLEAHLAASTASTSTASSSSCSAARTATQNCHGFGIIGCGMIAGFHQAAIAELPNARLVACFDAIPAAAERFSAAHGCAAYTDIEVMLADPNVTVVTVCTPSGAHLEPAVAAARSGKHVIVEKPLEVTLARCDAIIDACAAAGVTLGTVMPTRFHESSQMLKQAADAGRFGRLTSGGAYVKWYRTQEYYDGGAWRGTWCVALGLSPPCVELPTLTTLTCQLSPSCGTATLRTCQLSTSCGTDI